MNLDADRLAQLAGLPVAEKKNLNEASNRSLHDDPSVSDESEHRFGKNQLSERGALRIPDEEIGEEQNEGGSKKGDQSSHLDYMHPVDEDSETVEIDEAMLAEEIAKMRKERLQETELRGIIRSEIGSIIKGLKKESSKKTQRADKLRGITMGILGPGFR